MPYCFSILNMLCSSLFFITHSFNQRLSIPYSNALISDRFSNYVMSCSYYCRQTHVSRGSQKDLQVSRAMYQSHRLLPWCVKRNHKIFPFR